MKEKLTKTFIDTLNPKEKGYEVADSEVRGLALRVEPGGSKTYYLRYRMPDGQRGRVKIGSIAAHTPAEARKEALKKVSEAARGIDPRAVRKTKHMTLGDFVKEQYTPTWLANRRRSKEIASRLEHVFGSLWKTRLNEIRQADVEKIRSKRLSEKKATATVNKEITLLKSVLNRAVEWDFLDRNPLYKMRQLKEDKLAKVRYLSPKEERKLLRKLEAREENMRAGRDSANEWRRERRRAELPGLRTVAFVDALRPIVILSLNTGLRRGEVFNLHWEDVDLERKMLTVRGSTAKTGTTRHVPLNSVALDTIAKWRSQSAGKGLVFPNPKNGQRLDNLNTSWEGVLEDADIKKFRWHDMRHHFASKLVMAGVDLNTVRDLLGHSDIKMTLRYAHLAPEIKQQAVERIVQPAGRVVPFPRRRKADSVR